MPESGRRKHLTHLTWSLLSPRRVWACSKSAVQGSEVPHPAGPAASRHPESPAGLGQGAREGPEHCRTHLPGKTWVHVGGGGQLEVNMCNYLFWTTTTTKHGLPTGASSILCKEILLEVQQTVWITQSTGALKILAAMCLAKWENVVQVKRSWFQF